MFSQLCVFLLMLNAGIVAVGLSMGVNMWKWIILYWIVLTVKNCADFITGCKGRNRNGT